MHSSSYKPQRGYITILALLILLIASVHTSSHIAYMLKALKTQSGLHIQGERLSRLESFWPLIKLNGLPNQKGTIKQHHIQYDWNQQQKDSVMFNFVSVDPLEPDSFPSIQSIEIESGTFYIRVLHQLD